MIYHPTKRYDIPNVDLLTLLFDHEKGRCKESDPIHIEAADPSIAITKAQGRDLLKRIAHGLRQQYGIGASGPGKDVVISISSGQSILPVCFWGVVAAGGIYSAASPSSTAFELARQTRGGSAKLMLCSRDCLQVATAAARECNLPLDRVLVLDSLPSHKLTNVKTGASCISSSTLNWTRITDRSTLESTVICLLYSSGTTGVPKGVLVSHMNVVAEAYLPGELIREYLADAEARGEPPFEYRTLGHLPASHIAGIQGYFVNPIYHGGPVYWMPKFEFTKFLEYNKKFRITFFFTVPPIYLLIAKSTEVTNQFDSLRFAVSGAAPLGKELQYLASSKLGRGNCFISQTWGLSETTGSVTVLKWGEKDDTGSVSSLLPNVSIRVIDDSDQDAPPGIPGEILVQGPVVTKGYHNNPSATSASFLNGWFRTGDIGFMKDSKVYVVDRKKELIKYKGLQVAPAELEALLLSHENIADCAVIGVDGEGTELPRAYVVADQSKISAQQIKDFVKANASGYKQLRGGVVFLDIIPKSPSGKILRRELRDMVPREKKVGEEGRAKL